MSRTKVATIDQIPDGGGLRVDLQGHSVALFKVGSDVYAIGDRCSHAEASLSEGELFDDEVECPLHGAVFDVTSGKPKSLPATAPVPTFVVEVEGEDVLLEVEA
jgi:3-phenylpropionate/trans-cinnamate dioxygenase ferredoxin component